MVNRHGKSFFALIAVVFAIVLAGVTCCAEEDLDAVSDRYEDRFVQLNRWLETAPAPGVMQAEREKTLKTIDEPLAHPDADKLKCARDFFNVRMETMINDIRRENVEEGVTVWKLYNHGEVIQTGKIKIIIDLIEGQKAFLWDRGNLIKLIDMMDVLLVTHKHADHVDRTIVGLFLDRGKPVIVPELFWPDYPRNDELQVIREGVLNFPGAKVRVIPSYQKMDMVNVYLVTTDEGYKLMHLGDENEIMRTGQEWYRRIRKPVEIDILMPNIWCPNIKPLLDKVHPKVVLSSHEHEVGHPVRGRRPYTYVYGVLRALGLPYVVPMWGEPVRYKK
ncbi:MAG TPA: MBL fold metallo-hydrolase [bacterium]|nr:MBL fold metallo-hydrolase [bacterium]